MSITIAKAVATLHSTADAIDAQLVFPLALDRRHRGQGKRDGFLAVATFAEADDATPASVLHEIEVERNGTVLDIRAGLYKGSPDVASGYLEALAFARTLFV